MTAHQGRGTRSSNLTQRKAAGHTRRWAKIGRESSEIPRKSVILNYDPPGIFQF